MEKKTDEVQSTLLKMLSDDKTSSNECLAYYAYHYEDLDLMTVRDIEETARCLGKSADPDDIAQSKSLAALSDDNPHTLYFDYFNEKPINDKKWLKDKFNIA